MPSVLVALFWIWAVGSAVGYVWFRWKRKHTVADDPMSLFGAEPEPADPPLIDAQPAAVSTDETPAPAAHPTPVVAPAAPPIVADQAPVTSESTEAPMMPAVARALAEEAPDRVPARAAGATPIEPAPINDDLDMLQPAVAAVMRQEQIATAMVGESGSGRPTVAVGTMAPLSETLHGISMPVGLAPLSNVGPQESTERYRERLVMMTGGHSALDVAAGLRDALTAIDLDVQMLNDRTVIARRGDRAVEIRIHAEPTDSRTDESPLFPTAREGDVVVEFLAA